MLITHNLVRLQIGSHEKTYKEMEEWLIPRFVSRSYTIYGHEGDFYVTTSVAKEFFEEFGITGGG